MNFRQIRLAKDEGVAALRRGFCRAEMAEIQPLGVAGFNQRFLNKNRLLQIFSGAACFLFQVFLPEADDGNSTARRCGI